MWLPETGLAIALRAALAFIAPAFLAGCFQPLYQQAPLSGGPDLRNALAAIDVQQIAAANGSENARIAVELRNALLFELTGGEAGIAPTHRLNIKMATSRSA